MLVAGCASGTGPSISPPASSATEAPAKRITAAVQSDPSVLVGRLTIALEPGLESIENLYNPGLAGVDKRGALVPLLVEQVPTVEDGLWKVLPDGHMQMTWRL